jgi:large subunit ribosomal protein L29
MTKASVYRDKTPDELGDELVKLKKEQFNLRFQRASGQLEKTSRVREVRRDIAKVQTLLGQKARGEVVTAKAKAEKKVPAKKTAKAPAKRRAAKTKE